MKKFFLLFATIFFVISVYAQPIINENPHPLLECDVNNDGFAYFDLHLADEDISFGDSNLYFTYHINNQDAQMAINALNSPYINVIPYNQVVFARAMDPQNGLFSIVELELHVIPLLPITQPMDLSQIDEDGDGLTIFDLTENDAIVLEELFPAIYTVLYYETEENAERDEYAITDPTAYMNIQNPQTIYMRINNMSGSCAAFASFVISAERLSVDSFGLENLNVFPNPAFGNVTIQSSQLVSETTISLYDILGKMLLSKKVLPQNGSVTMDVSSFKRGVYFVKIYSEGNTVIRKLMKG